MFFALFLLPVFAYAEIHYKISFIPSLLFKKEPEIIFDLPTRALSGKTVPLFLFAKDAHRFPIQSIEVNVFITFDEQTSFFKKDFNQFIDRKFYSHIIELPAPLFAENGNYRIFASLKYKNSRKKIKIITQDNYLTIPHHPFQIYISGNPLPKTDNWYWGDLHTHSQYTDDQVEFGAPIRETVVAAETIGLDFLAITDHSYDLDDQTDNFLKNDPSLPRWNQMKQDLWEVNKLSPDLTLIPGEEVSVGNKSGKNVHCLILNDPEFHPGAGDSGENLPGNSPTMNLTELLQKKSKKAVAIAAHPWETPPLSQQLILNRGSWQKADCRHPGLTGLQILNGQENTDIMSKLAPWVEFLLEGRRPVLLAGNDAHGNFNCYRQIDIPFFKMAYSRNHILGNFRTGILAGRNSVESILKGIQNGRAIVSNGPFAIIRLVGRQTAEIGNTFTKTGPVKLEIFARSTPEYGSLKIIKLYFGNYRKRIETEKMVAVKKDSLRAEISLPLPLLNFNYVRMVAFTKMEKSEKFCATNPIWIKNPEELNE